MLKVSSKSSVNSAAADQHPPAASIDGAYALPSSSPNTEQMPTAIPNTLTTDTTPTEAVSAMPSSVDDTASTHHADDKVSVMDSPAPVDAATADADIDTGATAAIHVEANCIVTDDHPASLTADEITLTAGSAPVTAPVPIPTAIIAPAVPLSSTVTIAIVAPTARPPPVATVTVCPKSASLQSVAAPPPTLTQLPPQQQLHALPPPPMHAPMVVAAITAAPQPPNTIHLTAMQPPPLMPPHSQHVHHHHHQHHVAQHAPQSIYVTATRQYLTAHQPPQLPPSSAVGGPPPMHLCGPPAQPPQPPPPPQGHQWPIVDPVFHFGPGFERSPPYCPTHTPAPAPGTNEHVVLFHVNVGVSVTFVINGVQEVIHGKWKRFKLYCSGCPTFSKTYIRRIRSWQRFRVA